MMHSTRRRFLAESGSLTTAALLSATAESHDPPRRRPRVAAIYTVFTHRSHAHVILENFLFPYLFRGRRTDPGCDIVSFYADQRAPRGDLTDQVARRFQIPVYRTIEQALCLGGNRLAVDAILCIGEHGNYPVNELGQRMYPRKRFFDACVQVMRRSGRYVPLFNDKHLSYRWDWARAMYDTTLQFEIPFLAGSSVPLAERRPPLEVRNGARITDAVAIHGGPVESYDFHGLEILQSIVEFRRGGESGVRSVQFLQGDALWNAARRGLWSQELAEAAMRAELGNRRFTLSRVEGEPPVEPHAIVVHYRDGFRATVLRVGQSSTRWNIAWRQENDRRTYAMRWYVGPWRNRNLFRALAHAIQHLFIHRVAPYPVERTLLTTGILEAAMRSRAQRGAQIRTRHLAIAYQPRDFSAFRENGASWRIITEQTPEPQGPAAVGIDTSR